MIRTRTNDRTDRISISVIVIIRCGASRSACGRVDRGAFGPEPRFFGFRPFFYFWGEE